ncbi:hypothetical protein AAFF_G00284320 [Aldrovandia affinis]|uniref:Uncharacterized protein n=1 Tax=Aldrovandia affinis TaxID=143900 RepID=A0AAD7TA77_9TELE|nr:hypothetical protein AAFF_G00284320 [Aldrovandia affinis]
MNHDELSLGRLGAWTPRESSSGSSTAPHTVEKRAPLPPCPMIPPNDPTQQLGRCGAWGSRPGPGQRVTAGPARHSSATRCGFTRAAGMVWASFSCLVRPSLPTLPWDMSPCHQQLALGVTTANRGVAEAQGVWLQIPGLPVGFLVLGPVLMVTADTPRAGGDVPESAERAGMTALSTPGDSPLSAVPAAVPSDPPEENSSAGVRGQPHSGSSSLRGAGADRLLIRADYYQTGSCLSYCLFSVGACSPLMDHGLQPPASVLPPPHPTPTCVIDPPVTRPCPSSKLLSKVCFRPLENKEEEEGGGGFLVSGEIRPPCWRRPADGSVLGLPAMAVVATARPFPREQQLISTPASRGASQLECDKSPLPSAPRRTGAG